MADKDLVIKIRAVDEASRALASARGSIENLQDPARKAAAGIDSISVQLERAKAQFVSLFLVAPQIVQMAAGFTRLAETYKQINARLSIAAQSSADFAQAQERTRQIALKTGQSLESIAGLYGKLRVNAGLAASDAEKLTGIIAQATQLDGGGAGAQAAIFQLQQGLASGTLRGEELNSVLEQTPSLAKAIADGLGVNVGQLRKIAEQGGLTADVVRDALFKMEADVAEKFAKLPATTSRALENIRTQAIQVFGELDASLGVTSGLAGFLQAIADNMRAAIGITVAGTAAITAAWLQSIALRRAAEKAAHVARLQEILQVKTAELAAVKTQAGAAGGAAVVQAAANVVAARNAVAAAQAPVSALRTGLAALAGAFRLLLGPVGLAVSAIGAATGFLLANKDAVVDLGNGQATLGESVRAAWDIIKQAVSGAFAVVRNVFGGILETGRSAFGGVFDAAKTVVNGIVGFFIGLGRSIATVFAGVARQIVINFTGVKDLFAGLVKDIKAALLGDFSFSNFRAAASKALKQTGDNFSQSLGTIKRDFNQAFNTDYVGAVGDAVARGVRAVGKRAGSALLDQVRKNRDRAAAEQAEAFFNEKATGGTAQPGAQATPTKAQKTARDTSEADARRIADARLALEETLAAEAQRLQADGIERELAFNKQLYDDKKLRAEDYYALLTARQQALSDVEIAGLERQRDAAVALAAQAAPGSADQLRALGEVAKLNTDIAIAQRKLDDFKRDAAAGLAAAQADRIKAEFDTLNKQVEAAFAQLREREQELSDRVSLGAPQAAAEAAINAARRETLTTTTALLEQMRALAAANPAVFGADAQAQIAQYNGRLRELNVVVDSVADRINSTVSTAFEKLFADIGSGAATAADALRGFLRSIAQEINAVVAKNLSQQILGAIIPQGQAGQAGGLGGFVSGLLGGGAVKTGAQPGSSPAAPVFTREVGVPGVAGGAQTGGLFDQVAQGFSGLFDGLKSMLTNLASGLSSAFSSLFSGLGGGGGGSFFGSLLSGIGSLFGFASGGYVSGPGTATSDSIPARLSAGEYVIRAAAVKQFGVGFLDAINGLKRAPRVLGAGRLAFAAGGLVPAAATATQAAPQQPIQIVNSLDESVTLDHMQSAAGVRVILNTISSNPRAVRAALGG